MGDESELGQSANSDEQQRLNELQARFTKEQSARYQSYVGLREMNEERVTDRFRVFVAHTVLKDLSGTAESRDVKEFARREANNALSGFGDNAFRAPLTGDPSKSAQHSPSANETPPPTQAAEPIPKTPNAATSSRDYSELRRAHEQVAALQRPQGEQGHLSQKELETLQQRYDAFRSDEKLPQIPSDKEELGKLAREQVGARQQVLETQARDVSSGAATNHHARELSLIDHQHLAERVGTEARQILSQLKDRNPSMSEAFGTQSRQAFATGRHVHEERQNLHRPIARDTKDLPAHEREDRDKKAVEQEAAKGGTQLTADQKANLPANAMHGTDVKTKDTKESGKTALSKQEQTLLRTMNNSKGKGAERQR